VRARALRAPVFLSSLPPPNGALRAPPPRPSQLHCFLFDPQKYIKSIQLSPPTSRTFFFPLYRRGYEVPCPPVPPLPAIFWGQKYIPVRPYALIFLVFLFFSFWIFSFRYSLLFLLSFSISSYSFLLISFYSFRRAILCLLILLLLYFQLIVALHTCILIIYVHVGRLAKATFIAFFVYLCSTNVELVTKPNLDNNKQIYLNHQLLLTCVVLSLEYYVSYRTTYSGDHAD
jgi:hypothetical protein